MAGNEPGQEPLKTPEDARIDSLEERLRNAQQKEAERTGNAPRKVDENERQGNKVLSLLLGGLLGGTVIGYVLDTIFDTGNLLLVVGLFLGIVGAMWSIFKMVNK